MTRPVRPLSGDFFDDGCWQAIQQSISVHRPSRQRIVCQGVGASQTQTRRLPQVSSIERIPTDDASHSVFGPIHEDEVTKLDLKLHENSHACDVFIATTGFDPRP
ncbi:MAG: hypothetical protein L7W43_09085 [Rubripirellula sp.]|nr:hypothetical protein [Rubripirellula sp.]